MLAKAQAAGLAFDPDVLATNPLVIDPEIHDSKTGFYNVAPSHDRVIGLGIKAKTQTDELDPTQTLHSSVLKRWDSARKYRPDSLKNYFKKIGDPRGTGA